MTRPGALLLCLSGLGTLVASEPTPRLALDPAGPAVAVEGPVLAVAPLPGDRWAVLTRAALAVYRSRSGALTKVAEHAFGGAEPVRFPGGLLSAGDDAIWVLESGRERARLLAIDDPGLPERGQADILPWPGCPRGLRFRAGTNLFEGALEGLGDGPFLALADGVAVDADARLLVGTSGGPRPTELRAGPALASLGDGLYVAASASPPGPSDTLLLLARDGDDLVLLSEVPVVGAVRALAGGRGPRPRDLLVAAEQDGRAALLPFDIRRAPP